MENTFINKNENESYKLKPKWLNIKSLILNKSILENSINEIKSKKLSQFSSKLCEIYKEKIMIHSLIENNKNLISYWKEEEKNKNENKIIITKNLNEIFSGSEDNIIKFFFYFRENYSAMIRLIKYIPFERRKIFAKFLCHFFYDNYLVENEDEELIKIIQLLIVEEIKELLSPLSRNFLQDSFLKFLLSELGNTYKIGNYIDIILNNLIKDIEDKNSFNCYLNIIYNSRKHWKYFRKENKFFNMDKQEEAFIDYSDKRKKNKLGFILFNTNSKQAKKRNSEIIDYKNSDSKKNETARKSVAINKISEFKIKNINDLNNENLQIKNYINKDFFFNINENYFKGLLSSEKDEIMKSFYIKQIKILNFSKDKNIFSCHGYFNRMKITKNISKLAVEQFNNIVGVINNFIDKLLNNLENKDIIPFNIRIICKFIEIQLSKKFKNISKIQKNSLICNFLFRILIFPILENPDLCFYIGDMIISLNTRNILHNIYKVLSHLIEGELFNSNDNIYFTIFNNFIIKNYSRINKIIENIINISIPEIYINNEKSLNENKLDFIHYKSICFNSNEFLLFYNTIHPFKDQILNGDEYIENLFNSIAGNLSTMKFNVNNYYLITDEKKDDFIFKNGNYYEINTNEKNNNKIFKKLKKSIIYVLENLQLIFILDKDLTTPETFKKINAYLNYYFKPVLDIKTPPINWYSQYIVNNINLIDEEYKENDFQLLYDEIEINTKNILNEYKILNDYLTINLTLKTNILDKIVKIIKNWSEKLKKAETNIKSFIFIETTEIKICLMKGIEYNELVKSEKKLMKNNLLILSNSNTCPHNNINVSEKEKKYIEKKYHCLNIKDFAHKFSEYYNILSDEIMNFSIGNDCNKIKEYKENDSNNEKLSKEKSISSDSMKEILETYMNTIKKIIENDNIFFTDSDENSNIKKEELLNKILDYILKTICGQISSEKPLPLDDVFKIRCNALKNIVKPENLDIPSEIIDNNYMLKLKEIINIIDELRTPREIIKQFGLFIESINSLYKFFLNADFVEPDDLLNFIIYCILFSTPNRIVFKTNFSKFFLGEDEMIGNLGISVAQIESAISFIINLRANQIGISQQEFNDICSKINFS